MTLLKRCMFFIDGENLVFGSENMKSSGKELLNGVIHEPGVYVWHKKIITGLNRDILRVTYYTSAVCDYPKIEQIKSRLHKIDYVSVGERIGGGAPPRRYGNIVPKVFKRDNKRAKSHAVDINIAIDVLEYASLDIVDDIYLISGDGDYIPLIETVMRKGKRVHVMALSDGLHDQLQHCADSFKCIDDRLFKS
jgi:uncharacterized LabA/DUF88 family protein